MTNKIWIFFLSLTFLLAACSQTEQSTNRVPEESVTVETENPTPPPVETPPMEEEVAPVLPVTYINHKEEGGEFELPISGASGYAGIKIPLYEEKQGEILRYLQVGEGFVILEESEQYWRISTEDMEGWVEYRHCLVNLPDVIPSIIYENPYANICYSCSLGKDIPHVTGERLYEALFFNERLGEYVYLTPVLYETAKKINKIQESALEREDSLLIYECYRPYSVQRQLVDGLSTLMNQDAEVNRALTTAPWSKTWFVSTGISTHQNGSAVDLTLVRILETETRTTGDYEYQRVTAYEEYEMPTTFDELSPLAATFAYPVSTTGDAWKSAPYSSTMTEGAIRLQNYCTQGGLVPLASEWWHFNDNNGGSQSIQGDFMLDEVYSTSPRLEEERVSSE